MAGGLDFGVLPPEVNSGLLYAGSGPQSLVSAAAAWGEVASELEWAAGSCVAVLSGLTGNGWQGPAAVSMATAAAPLTSWMRATASHAAAAASQATAAVEAYENAFAATVPPAVVAANRAQLVSLVATNVLGQNTAAIAATEASYGEMWAQDAAAMYGYAGQSAAAAVLNPLSTPPTTTSDTGLAQQAAATGHATATAAGTSQTSLSQLVSTLPTTLNALASGSSSTSASTSSSLSSLLSSLGLNIFATNSGTSTTGLAGLINLLSGSVATPFSNLLNSTWLSNEFFAGYVVNPESFLNTIGDLFALGMISGRSLSELPAAGAGLLGPIASQTGSVTPMLGGAGALAGELAAESEVTATAGKAALVGGLSTPRTWTTAAPETIRLAAAASTTPSLMPGIGVGPLASPGMPISAAMREKSHSLPRYGFRLTVMPAAPTDNPI